MTLNLRKIFLFAMSLVYFGGGKEALLQADDQCGGEPVIDQLGLILAVLGSNEVDCDTIAISNNINIAQPLASIATFSNPQVVTWQSTNATVRVLTGADSSDPYEVVVIDGTGTTIIADTISLVNSIASVKRGVLSFETINSLNASSQLSIGDSGTVIIQSATSSYAGQVNLIGDGNVQIDTGLTITFGGVIQGDYGFAKTGAGTLRIINNCSYTGVTSVLEGTLALGGTHTGFIQSSTGMAISDGATFDVSSVGVGSIVTIQNLSGLGSVTLGATDITINQTDDVTMYQGVIGGTGALTKEGSGKWILTGANTFTGATIISEGTLALGGSHSGYIRTSSGIAISSGATFDISGVSSSAQVTAPNLSGSGNLVLGDRSIIIQTDASTTYSGAISGSGSLTKQGTETWVLSNNSNSFTGATTIAEGTLALGGSHSGYIRTSSGIAISSGATFDISGVSSSAQVTAPNLSGSGSVVLGDRSIIINQTDDITTFQGVISGTGAVTKEGSGKWILTGANTFTGGMSITAGTLEIDSFFQSSVTASNGSTLKGTGRIIGDVLMQSGSTIAPGSSPGELTIGGDLTLQSGSTTDIEVDAGVNSLLTVTGNITIQSDASLNFTIGSSFSSLDDTFVFATADQVIGTFSTATTSSPILNARVTYGSQSISAKLYITGFSVVVPPSNAANVGEAIYEIYLSGNTSFHSVINSLASLRSAPEIKAALNQMQPALYKGLAVSHLNNGVRVRESLGYRFKQVLNEKYCHKPRSSQKMYWDSATNSAKTRECPNEEKVMHAWVDGFGNNLHQASNTYANSAQFGYQTNTGGVVAGIDGRFAECCYLGALGGYTGSDIKWSSGEGKGDISSGYAGVYFSRITKLFYGNVSVIGGWNHTKAHRNIIYPGVSETATNSHGGALLISHADTGINLGYKGFSFRPFDSFDYISQRENGFTETGAGVLNLDVKKSSAITLRNELGLQFVRCMCLAGGKWTVSPKISWIREARVRGNRYTAEFVDTGVPFQVTGYFANRSLLGTGALFTGLMLEDRLALDLYYNGEFGKGFSDQSYGGQVRFGF